jgi:diguanylate cyclase (GGDEF)-like protein
VPAAVMHRRLLVMTALTLFGVVFASFILFEVPGLGIGHFFYIPVALIALACGWRIGILGGVLAAGLYALDIVVTPRVPVRDVLTSATVIRLVTYSSVGGIIGWFAHQYRVHIAQLRELAERDFLTGLINMRIFDQALAGRCASDKPFVLLLGDMDNLKQINDAHGHTEGNRVLQSVGQILRGAVGRSGEVARVGGDEFGILIDASLEQAAEQCARLRRLLAGQGYDMSFGWAAMPDDGVAPLELFRKADDRLFGAKLLNRNRRAVQAVTRTRAV